MEKVASLKIRKFAGEKTPAKAAFLLILMKKCNTNKGAKNPFFGGDAVYTARGLLFIDVEDDIDMSDRRAEHNNISNSKEILPTDFVLYPNPNNGNFTLDYHITDSDIGLLLIYDLAGRLISSCPFNSTETSIKIDGTQLSAGSYLYEIKINDRKIRMNKLIIVK